MLGLIFIRQLLVQGDVSQTQAGGAPASAGQWQTAFSSRGRGLCQEALLSQAPFGTSTGLTQKVGRDARGLAPFAQAWAKHVRPSVYSSVNLEIIQMPSSQRGEGRQKYSSTYYVVLPCVTTFIYFMDENHGWAGGWGSRQKEIENSSLGQLRRHPRAPVSCAEKFTEGIPFNFQQPLEK